MNPQLETQISYHRVYENTLNMLRQRGYFHVPDRISYTHFLQQHQETLHTLYENHYLYLPFSLIVYSTSDDHLSKKDLKRRQRWVMPHGLELQKITDYVCLNTELSFLTNHTLSMTVGDCSDGAPVYDSINIHPCPPDGVMILFITNCIPLCTDYVKHLIVYQRLINNRHMIVIVQNLENNINHIKNTKANQHTMNMLRQPNNRRNQNRRIEFFEFGQMTFDITRSIYHSSMVKLPREADANIDTNNLREETFQLWCKQVNDPETLGMISNLKSLYKVKNMNKSSVAIQFKQTKKAIRKWTKLLIKKQKLEEEQTRLEQEQIDNDEELSEQEEEEEEEEEETGERTDDENDEEDNDDDGADIVLVLNEDDDRDEEAEFADIHDHFLEDDDEEEDEDENEKDEEEVIKNDEVIDEESDEEEDEDDEEESDQSDQDNSDDDVDEDVDDDEYFESDNPLENDDDLEGYD